MSFMTSSRACRASLFFGVFRSMSISGFLSPLLLCVSLASASASDAVPRFNEIFYRPTGTNLLEQWFELYNPGNTPVRLDGWHVGKDVDFTFPQNTILPADGYLVVAADSPAFVNANPGVTNFVAGWTGTLSHSIDLSDASGQTVSAVDFYTEGDWATRVIGAMQYDHQGWEWNAPHNSGGVSLESISSTMPIQYAHNWAANKNGKSTPGRVNSTATANVAPFVAEVSHAPVIPHSSDPVTIVARIIDEHPETVVSVLHWRKDGDATFSQLNMIDDGKHGDGLASDGIFGAILPNQSNGTVVEFYIVATDAEGNSRVYPNVVPLQSSPRTANLLYQVDNSTYTGDQPVYRIIMTERERAEIYALGRKCPDSDSDAEMNATWITVDGVVANGTTVQCRYNAGVRNRGHGTRQANPNNYHVNIPEDRLWKGQAGINLNSHYAHSQVIGSAVFRKLGVPMADSRPVQVRVNSTNLMATVGTDSYGSYAANEQYNNDFIKRAYPLDKQGNSYRCIRDSVTCDPTFNGVADLVWHGSNPFTSAYTNAYYKQNHEVRNDWSDIIRLIGVLNVTNGTTAATYVKDVREVLDPDQWMKYMAINTLLDNNETCLANGTGDDYALYRGTIDTRFQALPYDMDTVLGRGSVTTSPRDGIFRMNALPVMARFMKTPEFAPLYYKWLTLLANTAFSPAEIDPLIDQLLGGFVAADSRSNMKAFAASHAAYVLSQVPLSLIVSNNLAVSQGYPMTTTSSVALWGQANAVDTRRVTINGTPATWSAWEGAWTNGAVALKPGINHVLVEARGENGVFVASTNIDIWYSDGSTQDVGGTIAANTVWTAAGGPYNVGTSLTVASGATLTIQPGACVYLASGVNFTVASGGRLLADGTPTAPILFTRAPGSTATWGGIVINGTTGSPETRITHAHIVFNGTTAIHSTGGTLYLDSLTFGSTDHQYLSLDDSSFVVRSCLFPTPTAAFEPAHGTGGVKTGGHGLFIRNFFGLPNGYNDVVDFTGGNRPGVPLVHFINNVFSGASDDILDLDGTDAWVEENIFLHCHKNGTPDSSSAVSGGNDTGHTSEVTILGNIFYDCDHIMTAKQGNFYTLYNNTILRQNHAGGLDVSGAVANLSDEGTTEGVGTYFEGNIIQDVEHLTRGVTAARITFTNNLISTNWDGLGGGNLQADARFKHLPSMGETYFSNWEQAQILREWLSLASDSPAKGTGPNGTDLGAINPHGVSIHGAPTGTNGSTSARLTLGILRTGNGIPAAGFPAGSGYTHYRWRLDGGAWSQDVPITTPIVLADLSNGPHHVEAVGKDDTGLYQDDPLFGEDGTVSTTGTWVVDTSLPVPPMAPIVQIQEVLANNTSWMTAAGTTPDLIELHNPGALDADLSGMGLTDSASTPYKFTFPEGTTLKAGASLVLYGDNASLPAGFHTGFGLKPSGDDLYLFARANQGGALQDYVVFGVQAPDLSIGRVGTGSWALCSPTFPGENRPVTLGNQSTLRINEWLADSQFVSANDFVELFNPDPYPVALGGLFFSDAAGAISLSEIPPLSYIAPKGYVSFIADGNPAQGANHVDFKLSPDVGIIVLSDANLSPIDVITYGPQRTDVSQGRSPSGSDTVTVFPQPSAGGPNPGPTGGQIITNIVSQVVELLTVGNTSWRYDNSGLNLGTTWRGVGYNDNAWSSGLGIFGYETTPAVYPFAFKTTIPAPDQANGHLTVYFRTHFQWTNQLENFRLVSTNYLDDGAAYYLNGVEVGRIRLAAGAVYTTTATSQPTEGQAEVLSIATNALVQGDNVLAVELHQTGTTSSDVAFGMSLAAMVSETNVTVISSASSIVLNEVLASNRTRTNLAGLTSDYIEIYNAATNAVDISGYSLTDDANQPRRWVFAPGTVVPALDHFVIYSEASLPPSSTNTGFNLAANGGAVFLFHQPLAGGALLDAVRYGLQTPDYAIGRIPDGSGSWTLNIPTPAAMNNIAGVGSVAAVVVNEWMADPSSGPDWFELHNTSSLPVALGGLFLTDNLADKRQSQIEPLSFIGTGAAAFLRFVADGKPDSGPDHVNFNLKKSGEAIGLFSPAGDLINGINFGAQVTGVSQGRIPDGGSSIVSMSGTASPGESNWLQFPGALINEVLTHTDPPLEDAVELYNPTSTDADLGGWFLSNDLGDLRKYRLPQGTTLPAHGFLVLYQNQFDGPSASTPFTFNSAHGDIAVLSAATSLGDLTGYRSQVRFGASANGFSFGRLQTSVGVDFTALATTTFGRDGASTVEEFRLGAGLPNSGPKVGPVVIDEISYSATVDGIENPDLEFLELLNTGSTEVTLFDPAHPTNTWAIHNAVEFVFPENTRLAAGARLVIVGFSPTDRELTTAFRTHYGIGSDIVLLGPWSGRLDNASDSVELYRPDAPQESPHPDAGYIPYVLVERVQYGSTSPWPADAAGGALSLQRVDPTLYGNDPIHWKSSTPTPGTGLQTAPVDSDSDSLPDSWELQYFGTLTRDGNADFDNDGMSDRQEFLAGTSPVDPADRLWIRLAAIDGGGVRLEFPGVTGHRYVVQFRDSLDTGTEAWRDLAVVGSATATAPLSVTDNSGSGRSARFYRVLASLPGNP